VLQKMLATVRYPPRSSKCYRVDGRGLFLPDNLDRDPPIGGLRRKRSSSLPPGARCDLGATAFQKDSMTVPEETDVS